MLLVVSLSFVKLYDPSENLFMLFGSRSRTHPLPLVKFTHFQLTSFTTHQKNSPFFGNLSPQKKYPLIIHVKVSPKKREKNAFQEA